MNGQFLHSTRYNNGPARPAAALFLAQFSQRLSTLPFGSTDSRPLVGKSRPCPRLRLRTVSTALLLMLQVALLQTFLPELGAKGTFLPERAVMKQLHEQGFGTVWLMQQQGDLYIAEGLSAEGNPVNIYVDSQSGNIMRTERRSILN